MKTVTGLKQGTVPDTTTTDTTVKQKIRSIGKDLEKLKSLCSIGSVSFHTVKTSVVILQKIKYRMII